MTPSADLAARVLRRADRVLVLTGAGMSAESGLATFRGAGGLWRGHDPMSLATPQAFERDPQLVWSFYHERRRRAFAAEPNAGHRVLVRWQQATGPDAFTLVTQNVDRLHRRAGSAGVIELHGNLDDIRCSSCHHTEDRAGELLSDIPTCPACGEAMRPEVVWFGEALPAEAIEQACEAAEACDVVLVVGTSRLVYPAAALVDVAAERGAAVIEINPDAEPREGELLICEPAAALMPRLVEVMCR